MEPSLSEADRAKRDGILVFWFGHIPGRDLSFRGSLQLIARLPFWAGKWGQLLHDVDAKMRALFDADLERAARGQYDHWAAEPAGRLALILLLDQFTRNLHRGTPDAFSCDEKVLPIAKEALARGEDQLFYPAARSFFYLPFVHQEDARCQDLAVDAYRRAMREAGGIQKAILLAEYFSALRHRQAIQRFGRFPHRNRILGRESTPDEQRFLRQPFSSF